MQAQFFDFFCDRQDDQETKQDKFFTKHALFIKMDFRIFSVFFALVDIFILFVMKPQNNFLLVTCIIQFIINIAILMYTFVQTMNQELSQYYQKLIIFTTTVNVALFYEINLVTKEEDSQSNQFWVAALLFFYSYKQFTQLYLRVYKLVTSLIFLAYIILRYNLELHHQLNWLSIFIQGFMVVYVIIIAAAIKAEIGQDRSSTCGL